MKIAIILFLLFLLLLPCCVQSKESRTQADEYVTLVLSQQGQLIFLHLAKPQMPAIPLLSAVADDPSSGDVVIIDEPPPRTKTVLETVTTPLKVSLAE